MTSTDTKIGMSVNSRPSSRVLKPPGGGHSNIFAEPETTLNAPRPKYNQQNSSNLNACMNSTDPNKKVEQLRDDVVTSKPDPPAPTSPSNSSKSGPTTNGGGGGRAAAASANSNNNNNSNEQNSRGRVPPGGFSSGGFW